MLLQSWAGFRSRRVLEVAGGMGNSDNVEHWEEQASQCKCLIWNRQEMQVWIIEVMACRWHDHRLHTPRRAVTRESVQCHGNEVTGVTKSACGA